VDATAWREILRLRHCFTTPTLPALSKGPASDTACTKAPGTQAVPGTQAPRRRHDDHLLPADDDAAGKRREIEEGAGVAERAADGALAAAVPAALGAQGTFVAMNNTVSQSVPHLHLHVVPRTKGDGLRGFFWPRTKYSSEEEMKEYAARVAAALAEEPTRGD